MAAQPTPSEPRVPLWLFQRNCGPDAFLWARRIFLALLGVTYFAAFTSYAAQARGLIGSEGILPAQEHLDILGERFDTLESWSLFPTLFWVNASDAALLTACWGGALLAIALVVGVAPRVVLLALWALYLSLTVVGWDFLGFQWDNLLLETGLLAVFVAPRGLWPRDRWREPPSRTGLLLLHFLLFKLMFLSGITKLLWEDRTWADLSALSYHYATQPLPSWISHAAHGMPDWFQQSSVVGMYAIELALPVLMFGPRLLRLVSAAGMVMLQLGILLTGNYGFFNLLTIALCVLLVDDRALERLLPRPVALQRVRTLASRVPLYATAAMLLGLSLLSMRRDLRLDLPMPDAVEAVADQAQRLRSVSGYGLFRTMTTSRPELVVEGSEDGKHWEEYEFAYKPGDPWRAPPIVGFHMPRLDWQMWFEALRTGRNRFSPSPWFQSFLVRLLEGSPEVLALLAHDPFAHEPPRFVRVTAYDYRFTSSEKRARTGAWWKRHELGPYTPIVTLHDGRLVQAW